VGRVVLRGRGESAENIQIVLTYGALGISCTIAHYIASKLLDRRERRIRTRQTQQTSNSQSTKAIQPLQAVQGALQHRITPFAADCQEHIDDRFVYALPIYLRQNLAYFSVVAFFSVGYATNLVMFFGLG